MESWAEPWKDWCGERGCGKLNGDDEEAAERGIDVPCGDIPLRFLTCGWRSSLSASTAAETITNEK